MNQRKLEALRNLAERPGTEAEGALARELLARFEARQDVDPGTPWSIFREHLRGKSSVAEFVDELARHMQRGMGVTDWTCACGAKLALSEKCSNIVGHLAIQTEIRTRFKKGDRVFYNYWAYPKDCPATVAGYVKLGPDGGHAHPWGWIRLKFDHLKSARAVPIYKEGWCLSHTPAALSDSPYPTAEGSAKE